jgi:hypothetical protein
MADRDDELNLLYPPARTLDEPTDTRWRTRLIAGTIACLLLIGAGAWLVAEIGFTGVKSADPRDKAYEDRR